MINSNSIDSHNSTVLQTVNVFTVSALVGSAVAPSSEVVTGRILSRIYSCTEPGNASPLPLPSPPLALPSPR